VVPTFKKFKLLVNELLEQGVVRPSKSQYANPDILFQKCETDVRIIVEYRKVNAKILFDSYPMLSIYQAFDQFSGAVIFSVFDINSADFQISLTPRSRRVTAFCIPFGLFEFNLLPMGIIVGSQGVTRVVDELFAYMKGRYVFN